MLNEFNIVTDYEKYDDTCFYQKHAKRLAEAQTKNKNSNKN